MIDTSVTQTGAGVSSPLVLDNNLCPFDVTLSAVVTPPVNYDIELTFDNVFGASYVAATGNWFKSNDASLVGATTNKYSSLLSPVTAVRINNRGNGTVVLTAIQGVKG